MFSRLKRHSEDFGLCVAVLFKMLHWNGNLPHNTSWMFLHCNCGVDLPSTHTQFQGIILWFEGGRNFVRDIGPTCWLAKTHLSRFVTQTVVGTYGMKKVKLRMIPKYSFPSMKLNVVDSGWLSSMLHIQRDGWLLLSQVIDMSVHQNMLAWDQWSDKSPTFVGLSSSQMPCGVCNGGEMWTACW